MRAYAQGQGSIEVTILADIPSSLTKVPAWCSKDATLAATACKVKRAGVLTASYFSNYVNAAPTDAIEGSFGGTAGVAQLRVSGTAVVIVKRAGVEIERKKVGFEIPIASPLEDPTLPGWAIDDIRGAIFSGAPEFWQN